jgi:hypothetical protein
MVIYNFGDREQVTGILWYEVMHPIVEENLMVVVILGKGPKFFMIMP